ncbi:MAG: S8 family serine peptidase, partial [Myxococcota bacterium]
MFWILTTVATAAPLDGPYVVALKPTVSIDAPLSERGRAVAEQQRRVIEALPPGSVDVLRRYQVLFGLVVDADAEALERLITHPAVRAVDRDVGGSAGLDQSIDWLGGSATVAEGLDGAGQKIAIVDTGLDLGSPALNARIVGEYCECLDEDGNGCCPNGAPSLSTPGASQDDQGHGTHVAGIAAGDGSVGSRGVAPAADLVSVKVIGSNNQFSSTAQVTGGLEWLLLAHPDTSVVNMSLGTFTNYDVVCDDETSWAMLMGEASDLLTASGTVLFASSGNDSDLVGVGAPACLASVYAVGNVHLESRTVNPQNPACAS